jgi:integrase
VPPENGAKRKSTLPRENWALLKETVPPETRLGHADPSITLRVYAHVIGEQLAEAAAIFARAVEAD